MKRAAEIAEKNQVEATTTDTTVTEETATTKTTTTSTTHPDTHSEITAPSLQRNVENPPSSKNSDAGATTRGRKRKVGGYVSPGDDENGQHSTDNDSETTDDEEEGVDDGFEEDVKKYLSSVAPPKTEFKWRKRDIAVSKNTFKNPPSLSSFNSSTTPVRLFNLFFDDEVISLLVKRTNSYARMEKGNVKYETNENEMRLFLAILLRSGYASMPRRCMYWEGREDVANSFVPNAMARNRFDLLMQYLHFSSPSDKNDDDKMWKIRSFYKLINERCLHYAMYASDLSIDESMIPYFGRHNSKQRIANKPIRVGFKMWVLAESTGYVINFDPYEGAKGKAPTRSSPTTWGLGEKVVLSLLEVLPKGKAYSVFIDNYFTSFRLLKHLKENGIQATGTVNKKRLEKVPIMGAKKMEKETRGYYERLTTTDNSVTLVGWNDNRPVYIASNVFSSLPLKSVRRWDKDSKQFINVNQPGLISKYNKGMGGVDRTDQNISTYRIGIRGKKWWWSLFVWTIDMAMQNAWLLYRQYKSAGDDNYGLYTYVQKSHKLGIKRSILSCSKPSFETQ